VRTAVASPMPARQSHAQLGVLEALGHAYRGLLHALAQRNMKIHVVSAVLVGLVGSGIRLGLAEKVTLIVCVILVFFAEILNTALEALVDLHTEDFNDLAKITKDAAAAGVLVLAIGTVVIFTALLVHNWDVVVENRHQVFRQAALGIPLAMLTAVLLSRWHRPAWVDHLLFVVAMLNWGALWMWTVSWVFTTLTGALVWLSWRASRQPGQRDQTPA
jgi:diacylglycerol kinase (ATP)